MSKSDNIKTLFIHTLKDIYQAERCLSDAIAEMADEAASKAVQDAFEQRTAETQQHIDRLIEIYGLYDVKLENVRSAAIDGILDDGDLIIDKMDDGTEKDLAMIAIIQAAEQYERARYGSMIAWAKYMGDTQASRLLKKTLKEDKAAKKSLAELSQRELDTKSDDETNQ